MKKIISFLLLTASTQQLIAQTETFDIATYTAPEDFKKDTKQGVVNYINVNEAKGSFCVIAIYASAASTGDAENDFKKEWNALVVKPYKAEQNPKTETQTTDDGWEIVTAASPIKLDGTDCYIILTVASGFGKRMSIRTSMNDEAYTTQLDALFATMELDKTKNFEVNKNTEQAADNIVTTASNTGREKFRLMQYTPPPEWSHQVFTDGVVFKPLNLPAGEHLAIQVMEPLNTAGTLEEVFAKSFEEATIMYKGTSMYQADGKYSKNAAQRSFNGWEYIRGKGGIKATDGAEYGLELFVIKINNRFERVTVLESRKYCGGVSRYYTTDRISYRNAIESLLFSLQFTDFNAQPLKAGLAKGNAITGVWEGSIQSTGAATGVRIEVFSPIFFNNGQVYFGNKFPTEGLNELNSRIPAELFPRNWGNYTFSNGSGILKMPFADIPFRLQGDKLIFTKNQRDWPFYKLNSVDGAKFSGSYKMSESYGIIPVISFTADGHFSDNGAIRILCHDGVNCVNPGYKPGTGTYEVKDHTVSFNYSDGRKVKIAFLGTGYEKNNAGPATLRMSYNDDPMTKQ